MTRRYLMLMIVTLTFAMSHLTVLALNENIGTEGAAFLKIDAATRPVAMGGAYVGLANDVNSVFWNPAGLVQTEKKELSTMYNSWIAGINYGSVAYSQPIGPNAVAALSIQGLWADIERRTGDTEKPDSTFGVHSFAAGLSGSYAIIPKVMSLGITVKAINQDFDVADLNGAAGDFGALIKIGNLGLGASAQNIKFQMSDDLDLPTTIRIGTAYQISKDSVISVEYAKFGSAEPGYHFGFEKWIRDVLALRIGYCIGADDNPKKGLSAGFGLKAYGTKPLEYMNFQLDYAYVPAPEWGNMGDSHRVSMIVRF